MYKVHLLIVLFTLSIISVSYGQQTQPENPGFEEWEDVGLDTDEPVEWSSIKTSDDSFLNGLAPYVWDKSTDAHTGNYSVKLFSVPILNFVAAGAITNGRIHADFDPSNGYMFTDPTDDRWNTPINTRPDSVAVWVKFLPMGNDTAQVKALLHTGEAKLPDPTQSNWVGLSLINVPGTTNGWVRVSAPFEYFNSTTPEYILFVVSSAGTVATEGTEVYYDDFELIYNPIKLDLTVFLEGPYKNAKKMTTDLNPELLPLEQPFNSFPWAYSGDESVTIIPSEDIVDWCLVEVRDASTPAAANGFTIKGRQAAFILKNGDIVGMDGSSKLTFDVEIDQNLYVTVFHRNHLAAISAYPLTEADGVHSYDFSNGVDKIYGGSLGNSQLVVFGPGLWGMTAGNGDANRTINMNDKTNFWSVFVGKSGYHSSDYNLDGQISNQDKNKYWQKNLDKTSQVPN